MITKKLLCFTFSFFSMLSNELYAMNTDALVPAVPLERTEGQSGMCDRIGFASAACFFAAAACSFGKATLDTVQLVALGKGHPDYYPRAYAWRTQAGCSEDDCALPVCLVCGCMCAICSFSSCVAVHAAIKKRRFPTANKTL